MKYKKRFYSLFIAFFLLQNLGQNILGAENIYLYKGTFSRTIAISDLEDLVKKGKAEKRLKKIIKMSNQKEDELTNILKYEFEIPIKLASKLLYSKIGETILKKISEIIYPNKYQNTKIGIFGIRSALLIGLSENNGKLSILKIFKAYPNKNIGINLNSLSNALNKVESLSELIKFYSESPLEKLKEGRSKT